MSRLAKRSRHGCLSWWVVGCANLLLTGCVVIPVNYHLAGSRHNITEETASILQPGSMTKVDVLMLLGEPDYVSDDARRFGYVWKKVRALVVVGGGQFGAGGAMPVVQSHLLQVWFDASDHIFQVGTVKDWGGQLLQVPPAIAMTTRGTGNGTVISSPTGINCGLACSASYATGTTITLTAIPASGSIFVGWTGACTGTEVCELTLDANTHEAIVRLRQPVAVTATFDLRAAPTTPSR